MIMSRKKAADFNFFSLAIIVSEDHAFSQGKSLRVATTHPLAKWPVKIDRAVMRLAKAGDTWEGKLTHLHGSPQAKILLIDEPTGTSIRLIELVTHEVSHYVDELFAQCGIQYLHTEVRAYYMDWIVGKVLRHFKL